MFKISDFRIALFFFKKLLDTHFLNFLIEV